MPKLSLPNGRAFDAGLAAFAAISAGFVAFAMPDPLFGGLVETSRLPVILDAARPPLGDTARFAAVSAALIFTFAAVWALLATLSGAPARRETVDRPETAAPRLRRADAHPDAPPRPPLLARDLGEPLELDEVAEEPAAQEPLAEADLRPLPGFLIPQEPEPAAGFEAESGPAEVEPEAELEADPVPAAEAEPAPASYAEPLPIAELAARLPDAEEEDDQPLAQLVNRIEFGLSRKRQALPAAEMPPVAEPEPEAERVGHRLRSAINDLQKIASSGA